MKNVGCEVDDGGVGGSGIMKSAGGGILTPLY